MKLLSNADSIVEKEFRLDNVIATKKALETNIANSYKTKFFQELQIYVTKIGIALSKCVQDVKITTNTYLGSIDYVCKKILKNRQLYEVMRAIKINDEGNKVKHSNKNVEGDIEYTLKQYNQFVSEIIKGTKINAFKLFYLNKKKSVRDIPLVEEKRNHKYFVIKNVKFQLKINENYDIDLYEKKGYSKLTLYWPEANKDYAVNVVITNALNGKILGSISELKIDTFNSKHAFELSFSEADLDRRILKLKVDIKLLKLTNTQYETGALFWKKTHVCSKYEVVGKYSDVLTQLYKPQR